MKLINLLIGFIGKYPFQVFLTVMLATLSIQTLRVETLKSQLGRAHTVTAEVQMDAMNERATNNKVVTVLIDSITRLSVKQVVQRRPARDTAVAAVIVAHVDSVVGELTAVADGTATPHVSPLDTLIRHDFNFPLNQRPFHGVILVATIGREARMNYQIGLEPAHFRAGIACGAPVAPANLRPATLALQGPDWLRIDSVQVFATPNACNPPPVVIKRRGIPLWLVVPGFVFTVLVARAL